jgi:hypothetical protein
MWEHSCAYWVPLEDWRGETVYIKARGVDYIARLPGCESPMGWYSRFPQLAAERDEQPEDSGHIDMMIALDNLKWMPVRQACRLVGLNLPHIGTITQQLTGACVIH